MSPIEAANIGAKRTLIKQPPPKRAQRQFERMWNVAKPGGAGGGGDDFDYEEEDTNGPANGGNEDEFRRPKTSLLGRPPPPAMQAGDRENHHESEQGQLLERGMGLPPHESLIRG